MCGIAGFFSPRLTADQTERIASEMLTRLRHRGPDSQGQWKNSLGVRLLHTRLAVVDLSAEGHQPMISRSGRFVMTYNGEIYNHKDLREELEKSGYPFRGQSDTEVLLALIELWGVYGALKKISGMFAIAVFDQERSVLTLARDRLGEKPLYYGIDGADFVFGSELKALRALSDFPFELDRQAMLFYRKYNYIPAPLSIYSSVKKLQAGHFLEVEIKGRPRLEKPQPYWSLRQLTSIKRQDISLPEAKALVKGKLSQIIGRQLQADVPVGCFLSGGIDSSLVAAMSQDIGPGTLKTFTIGFQDQDYNEAPMARQIASHLGTDHQEWIVEPKNILSLIPKISWTYDEPFADSSQLPTAMVSQLTRQKVVVGLSGDGGDELFGGYNRYLWADKIWQQTAWIPRPLRLAGRGVLNQVPQAIWRNLGGIQNKVAKVADLLEVQSREELYDRLLSCWYSPQPSLVEDVGQQNFIEYMMLEDSAHYLPDDIMVKVDRATMAVSLESRAPLLDHELYELMWSLPLKFKVHDGVSKILLREILTDYVPSTLWNRPKTGFGVPLEHWFRGELKEWISDLLSYDAIKSTELFDPDVVQKCLKEHISGRANHQHLLWNVVVFQDWNAQWRQGRA